MVDKWISYTDTKNMVGAVLLDFSAALEVLDHGILIRKLTAYGFSQNAITWMNSYLSNRMQCVFFNGSFLLLNIYSVASLRGAALVLYFIQYLQMTCL